MATLSVGYIDNHIGPGENPSFPSIGEVFDNADYAEILALAETEADGCGHSRDSVQSRSARGPVSWERPSRPLPLRWRTVRD